MNTLSFPADSSEYEEFCSTTQELDDLDEKDNTQDNAQDFMPENHRKIFVADIEQEVEEEFESLAEYRARKAEYERDMKGDR